MVIQIDNNYKIIRFITLGGYPENDPSYIKLNRDDVDLDIIKHIYDYKYINGEFVFDTEEYNNNLMEVKKQKKASVSNACHKAITGGIDFNGEHYSLQQEDQTNLTNLSLMSQSMPYVPYHADGQLCRRYSAQEIQAIASAAINWVTFHTTYHNFLKAYIDTINDIEILLNIHYGSQLPNEYMQGIIAIMGTDNIEDFMVDIPDTLNYDGALRVISVENLIWEEDQHFMPESSIDYGEFVDDLIDENGNLFIDDLIIDGGDDNGEENEKTLEDNISLPPEEEFDIPEDNS